MNRRFNYYQTLKTVTMMPAVRLLTGVTFLFLCIACQKEISYDAASGSTTSGSVNGVLKMKINGMQWTADKGAGASLMNGVLNISGIGKDKKYFTITLTDTIARTYILNDTSFHAAALLDSMQVTNDSYATNGSDDRTKAGGTVTVTAIDKVKKTVSGTFKFNMFRQADNARVVITEGVFDKLPYATTVQPANATDTFNVKIDGIPWAGKSIVSLVYGGKLMINATELNATRTVGLQLPDNITAGTYNLTALGAYMGIYAPDLATTLVSDPGTITIIERNTATKRVRGNFTFTAAPITGTGTSYSLTQGYFSLIVQ